jgi:hypothetical protein
MTWQCNHGTPDEDHRWRLMGGDRSVGEGYWMECRECGETKEATEKDIQDAYNDADFDGYET